eukprot:12619945-Alexandrium_andersonii.AAC.1
MAMPIHRNGCSARGDIGHLQLSRNPPGRQQPSRCVAVVLSECSFWRSVGHPDLAGVKSEHLGVARLAIS